MYWSPEFGIGIEPFAAVWMAIAGWASSLILNRIVLHKKSPLEYRATSLCIGWNRHISPSPSIASLAQRPNLRLDPPSPQACMTAPPSACPSASALSAGPLPMPCSTSAEISARPACGWRRRPVPTHVAHTMLQEAYPRSTSGAMAYISCTFQPRASTIATSRMLSLWAAAQVRAQELQTPLLGSNATPTRVVAVVVVELGASHMLVRVQEQGCRGHWDLQQPGLGRL